MNLVHRMKGKDTEAEAIMTRWKIGARRKTTEVAEDDKDDKSKGKGKEEVNLVTRGERRLVKAKAKWKA